MLRGRGGVHPWGRCALGGVSLLLAFCVMTQPAWAEPALVRQIKVGTQPQGLALDGTHVWVVNAGSESVSEINQFDGEVVKTIPVTGVSGGGGASPEISADGTHVWVVRTGSEGVVEISAASGEVVRTVSTPPVSAISSDGSHVWVAGAGDKLIEIEASTGTVVEEITLPAQTTSVSSDGEHVWVVSSAVHALYELEAATGELIRTIPVGEEPRSVVSDGIHVWVANFAGESVTEVEAATGSVLRTIKVGKKPDSLAADGAHLWVANAEELQTISEIDEATGEVVNTLGPIHFTRGEVASDGRHLWLAVKRPPVEGALKIEEGLAEFLIEPQKPSLSTSGATEVEPTAVTLNATVDPNGPEVTKCVFEYGPTASYGSSAACATLPGAGEQTSAVSAAVSGLSAGTTYHFRVVAQNSLGTSYSADATLTTTASSESGSTLEPAIPAEAKDEALTATASGGVGTVSVGVYKSDPAKLEPFDSSGTFSDVALAPGSDFSQLEVKNCEVGAAKGVWWANAEGIWSPVSPTAVSYTKTPACVVVTITSQTSPDLAQMTGTRFGYALPGPPELGKCIAHKDGEWENDECSEAPKKIGKGKYDWLPVPVGCYPQKDGNYKNSECTVVAEKKGVPDHKGKYELAAMKFTGTIEAAKVSVSGLAPIECAKGHTEGEFFSATPKGENEELTLEGCTQQSASCSSGSEAGVLHSSKLQSYLVTEDPEEQTKKGQKKAEPFFFQLKAKDEAPILSFTCGTLPISLIGSFAGEATGDVNTMDEKWQVHYKPGLAEEAPFLAIGGTDLRAEVTITEAAETRGQAEEISTRGE